MENKELIEKIIKYLEKQPTHVINRICANLMIDLTRWYNYENLPTKKKINLMQRTTLNVRQLYKFFEEDDYNESLTYKYYD